MVSILAMADFVNLAIPTAEDRLTDHEMYAMRLCVTVFWPVTVATDEVQAEHVTIRHALSILGVMRGRIKGLLELNYGSAVVRKDITAMANALLASLQQRETMLTSRFVELLEFLDPTVAIPRCTADEVRDAVIRYWQGRPGHGALDEATKRQVNEGLGELQIQRAANSKLVKPVGLDQFWESRAMDQPFLYKFFKAMTEACVTEAAVERTFKAQKGLMRSDRCRLGEATINDELMLKFNIPRLQEKTDKVLSRAPVPQIMSIQEWSVLCSTLSSPDAERGVTTRLALLSDEADTLQLGFCLSVKWTMTEKKVEVGVEWWEGVLVNKVEAKAGALEDLLFQGWEDL